MATGKVGCRVLAVLAAVLGCWRAARAEGSDLYLSTAETAILLESEQHLLDFVRDCLTRSARRTGNAEFSRLARELQTELKALPQGGDPKHPLDAYVGLRRFTQYWSKYIARLEPRVARSVEQSLANNHIVFPDQAVLQQARRAIVRLQASYRLAPSTLLRSATANLTAADVALLAGEAEGLGLPSVAEGWRRLAESPLPSSESSMPASSRQRKPSENIEVEETLMIQRTHRKFYSLCQHLMNSSDTSAMRSERCEYRTGSTPLSRWKTEVLRAEPPVVLFYDFVSEREAAIIVDRAMDKLQQAYTGPTVNDSVLRVHRRLGKVAWLHDFSSLTLHRVTQRIQEVTRLHAIFRPRRSFGEHFQVVNYGIGGHYIPHYDYFKQRNAFSEAEVYLKDSGDRAATFMIYLGDVSQGGATVFPRLGIGAPPIKRAALFWYNFSPDGSPDSRSLHGGCPIVIGEKWVANKWIHEISTAMTRSCQTTPWRPDTT